jgi:hypothetical protein
MPGSRVFNELDAGLRRHDELIRASLLFKDTAAPQTLIERPFSLRDACRDAGGRAKHGAIAEKDRMRG